MRIWKTTNRVHRGPAYARKHPDSKTLDHIVVVYEYEGKRHYESFGPPTPEAHEEADAFIQVIKNKLRRRELARAGIESITFEDAAANYLAKGVKEYQLAPSTIEDRVCHLRKGGHLSQYFGALPLSEIGEHELRDWWSSFITNSARTHETGMRWLSSITGVFDWAMDCGQISETPVSAFRLTLRKRRRKTRASRTENVDKRRPIEKASELNAFVDKVLAYPDREIRCALLMLLDGGMRLGEAWLLNWRWVWWGRDEEDTTRHLRVHEARARGKYDGATKTGAARNVPMSLRLRRELLELWMERGRPEEGRIVQRSSQKWFRKHFWDICRDAGIGRRNLKDLRCSCASHLLSAGRSTAEIAKLLGHKSVTTTERHYALYIPAPGAIEPMKLEPGEVLTDMLSRLISESVTIPSYSVTTLDGYRVSS